MNDKNSATKIVNGDHWKNNFWRAKHFGLLSSAFLQLLIDISKSHF